MRRHGLFLYTEITRHSIIALLKANKIFMAKGNNAHKKEAKKPKKDKKKDK